MVFQGLRRGWRLLEPPRPPGERSGGLSRIERLEFLLDSSSLLSSTLDYRATLRNVVSAAVPAVADACFLQLRETGGRSRIANVPRSSALERPAAYRPGSDWPEEPEVVSAIAEDWWTCLARDTDEAAWLPSLGFRSALRAPLAAGDVTLGMLTLLSATRSYSAADMPLMLDLTRMAATAIEHARAHAKALEQRGSAAATGHGAVLATLNHELRNLLSPILGWARILRDHPLLCRDEILHEGTRSLDRNARHMSRLVDDCLHLSRMAEGKVQLSRTAADVNEVMLAALEAVREAAWEKKLSLLVELSSVPLLVHGDAARLQQVGMNLLTNAVKYTGSGGRLYVRSFPYEGEVEIEVTDTGRGIDPRDIDSIFEPFHQGAVPQDSGLGLGLAISREIIELHDGRIWAESGGIGRGCTIRFCLPRLLEQPRAAIAPASNAAGRKPARRVLLVDDSADVRTLLKIQMERMGHTVSAVADAWSAIAQARQNPPDLVVSDIRMPGLDGYSFARMLRDEPATAHIPLLGITGLSTREGMEEARASGFDACLPKPVEEEQLAEWIQRLAES